LAWKNRKRALIFWGYFFSPGECVFFSGGEGGLGRISSYNEKPLSKTLPGWAPNNIRRKRGKEGKKKSFLASKGAFQEWGGKNAGKLTEGANSHEGRVIIGAEQLGRGDTCGLSKKGRGSGKAVFLSVGGQRLGGFSRVRRADPRAKEEIQACLSSGPNSGRRTWIFREETEGGSILSTATKNQNHSWLGKERGERT